LPVSYGSNTPPILPVSLTRDEQTIITLQDRAKPFNLLSPDEQIIAARDLVLYLNLALSWDFGNEENFDMLLTVLADQLATVYGSLNLPECKEAAKIYGPAIETYGKPINLQLLQKILLPYMGARAAARQLLERLPAIETAREKPLLTSAEYETKRAEMFERPGGWFEITEMYYQRYITGSVHMQHWPVEMYEALIRGNYIHPEKHLQMLAIGKRWLIKICFDAIADEIHKPFHTIGKKIHADQMAQNYRDKLKSLENENDTPEIRKAASLYAVRFAFSCFKKQGVKRLFVQDPVKKV